MMDTRLKVLAVLPLLLIVATLFTVSRIDLERFVLRPAERRMLHFSPDKSEMGIGRPVNFFHSEATGKETHPVVKRAVPPGSVSQKQDTGPDLNVATTNQTDRKETDRKENVTPEQDSDDTRKNLRLTFIVLNGGRSIAIVDDHVMHEGESMGSITVQKIEQDRVLVRDRILRWIYMEDKK